MSDPVMRSRFEHALSEDDLRRLARSLVGEGQSQVAVYWHFHDFYLWLRSVGRERDEDRLADAMEFIVGWCSAQSRWFERVLTNEEIEDYRSENGPLP